MIVKEARISFNEKMNHDPSFIIQEMLYVEGDTILDKMLAFCREDEERREDNIFWKRGDVFNVSIFSFEVDEKWCVSGGSEKLICSGCCNSGNLIQHLADHDVDYVYIGIGDIIIEEEL